MTLHDAWWHLMTLNVPCCNTLDLIMNDLMMFWGFGHSLTNWLTHGRTTLVVKSLSRLKTTFKVIPNGFKNSSLHNYDIMQLRKYMNMRMEQSFRWFHKRRSLSGVSYRGMIDNWAWVQKLIKYQWVWA